MQPPMTVEIGVAKRLLTQAKHRAKKRGLPFNIELEDIPIPAYCPVLGIPIHTSGRRGNCANSPSIDRIIPSLGYVKGNVLVVSVQANRIKTNATPEEIQLVASFYAKLLDGNGSCE